MQKKNENFFDGVVSVLQLQEVPGLAERMASIMCVVDDLNSDSEEKNEALDYNNAKRSVFEVVESELCAAKEKGDGNVKWLELDELGIDDDTLLSLDLGSKFPVSACENETG